MKHKFPRLTSVQEFKNAVFDFKTHFSILIEISNIFT